MRNSVQRLASLGVVCTVVVDLSPESAVPLRLLAIRDELTSRPFDVPSAAWPAYPALFGGRDRQAGGTWCVSDVATGVTAALLNRIERRVAEPGAPSRGELPLLAAIHGSEWPAHISLDGMASFNLLLATPSSATMWAFDGSSLIQTALAPGTHMLTLFGANPHELDPRWGRWMRRLAEGAPDDDVDLDASTESLWSGWLEIVRAAQPSDDPSALIVRHPLETGEVYATVFGQLIAARPGELRVDYSMTPWTDAPWTTLRRSDWLGRSD